MNCEICGRRGRDIKDQRGNVRWLCFVCYHDEEGRKFHKCKDPLTATETLKQRALQEFYLKPLFYREQPNLEYYQIACDIAANINPHLWSKLYAALEGK